MTDARLESMVAAVLRTGVMLAALIVAIGGIGYLIHHGHDPASYRSFRAEPAIYRKIPSIAKTAAHADWPAIIQLGLLLLIATPIVRVGLALVAFALERDRIYVAVTAIVLAVLLFSLTSS